MNESGYPALGPAIGTRDAGWIEFIITSPGLTVAPLFDSEEVQAQTLKV